MVVTMATTMRAQKALSASGKRQETEPVVKLIPKFSQALTASPELMKTLSKRTAAPRCAACEHSLCQLGAVAVKAPKPIPET